MFGNENPKIKVHLKIGSSIDVEYGNKEERDKDFETCGKEMMKINSDIGWIIFPTIMLRISDIARMEKKD